MATIEGGRDSMVVTWKSQALEYASKQLQQAKDNLARHGEQELVAQVGAVLRGVKDAYDRTLIGQPASEAAEVIKRTGA